MLSFDEGVDDEETPVCLFVGVVNRTPLNLPFVEQGADDERSSGLEPLPRLPALLLQLLLLLVLLFLGEGVN
mgnify:CR=1 FL=1